MTISCILFISLISVGVVFAQNYNQSIADLDSACGDFDCEELEITSSGITPDNIFYFLDELFDGFGNSINVKEEKIAEIKTMIEKEDYESARKALKLYSKYAESVENEADPEEKEATQRSAETIKKALRELKNEISEENKEDFYYDIVDKENNILTAVEISDKIKELCKQLAELDPVQYGKLCVAEDDSPRWQKRLDRELTEEDKKEVLEFGEIMSECFETSGQTCRCDDIPFPDFANVCKKAAPLAVECRVYQDQTACNKLDELELPELPEHLQDVMDELEGVTESKFDIHMPKECIAARATTGKECNKIMIRENAPEECKKALLESGCGSERECQEICDGIMMEIHSPECVEQGIKDPNDCQDYLFNINRRPEECIKNKIHDARDCKDFLESTGKYIGKGLKESLKSEIKIDFDCKSIVDPTKRLECYDNAANQAEAYKGFDDPGYNGPCMTEEDWKRKKEECHALYGPQAGDEPIRGDSGQGYECVIDAKCIDFSYKDDYDAPEECIQVGALSKEACKQYMDDISKSGVKCDDCVSKCPDESGKRLRGTGCSENGCECYYEDIPHEESIDSTSGEISSGGSTESTSNEEVSTGESGTGEAGSGEVDNSMVSESESTESSSSEVGSSSSESSSGVTSEEPAVSSDSSGSSGGETSGGLAITGEVIRSRFLDYWFSR